MCFERKATTEQLSQERDQRYTKPLNPLEKLLSPLSISYLTPIPSIPLEEKLLYLSIVDNFTPPFSLRQPLNLAMASFVVWMGRFLGVRLLSFLLFLLSGRERKLISGFGVWMD